jgi:hypothetical protein
MVVAKDKRHQSTEASMNFLCRSTWIAVTLLTTNQALAPSAARAQTPAQMEYERQQREYARQQEQQRQEQQRQQQLMNENARRQQEESRRINTPTSQSPMPAYPDATVHAAPRQQAARTDANAATATSKWVRRSTLSDYGGVDIYSDSVTARRSKNMAQMWEMWDFKTPQLAAGIRFISLKNLMEFDCKGARRRLLATTGYSAHLGQGMVVASSDQAQAWGAATAGYPETLWKIACEKK